MLDSGSYKIFQLIPTKGDTEENYIGRFLVQGGEFFNLEDHTGMLQEHLPDGPMNDIHKKALQSLMNSGYYKVVHEKEISQGHHETLIPELDLGADESPEAEYILTDEMGSEPKRVEMYGEVVIIDGQKVEEKEYNKIMDLIHSGKMKLIPI
jgi:hypothetical protein